MTRRALALLPLLLVLLAVARPSWAQLGGVECPPLPGGSGLEREVVFLLDGSGSIDSTDWVLEKNALKAALEDEDLLPRDGTVAVAVLQFSTQTDPSTRITTPYTQVEKCLTPIENETSVFLLEAAIDAMVQLDRGTGSAGAITEAANFLANTGESSTPLTSICLLTDGVDSLGMSAVQASADVQASGVVGRLSVAAVRDRDVFLEANAVAAYTEAAFGGGQLVFANSQAEFGALFGDNCLTSALRLRAFEVNQSVQDWNGSIQLVEGKDTIVRAFLEPASCAADPAAVASSTARLHGSFQGVPLPGPILPFNGSLRAAFDCTPDDQREDPDASLNFRVPRSWLGEQITFQLELPGGIDCDDGQGVVERCQQTVDFAEADFPALTLLSLPSRLAFDPLDPDLPRPLRTPGEDILLEQEARIQAILPVARTEAQLEYFGDEITGDVEYEVDRTDPSNPVSKLPRDVEDNVMRELKWYFWRARCEDGSCPTDRIHGLIDHDAGVIGTSNANGLRVSVSSLGNMGGPLQTGHFRNSAPHELAHNFRTWHTTNSNAFGFVLDGSGNPTTTPLGPCGEVAPANEPPLFDFIYSIPSLAGRSTLGPLNLPSPLMPPAPLATPGTEMWGVAANIPDWGLNADLAIADPYVDWPFMSYCRDFAPTSQNWISSINYSDILALLQATNFDEPLPPGSDDSPDLWWAVGGIFRESGLDLAPVYHLPGPGPYSFESGPYTAELLDASGTVLASASFAAVAGEQDVGVEDTLESDPLPGFFVTLADPGTPVAEVVIREGTTELARRAASASPPAVSIVAPAGGTTESGDAVTFAWSGTDADGDPLEYALDYSADNGVTWVPLAVGVDGSSLAVARSWLRGGPAARFRVTATDGLRSTTATSEAFGVADNPPVVVVRHPRNEQRYASAQRILLDAVAFDREDGRLSGESVEWLSSRNGLLGNGTSLEVGAEELAEGEHVIAVRAVDSQGAAGGASTKIFVSRLATPRGADPDFTMRIDPPARAINPGDTTDFRVYVTPIANFEDPVSLSVIGLPDGWTATFTPSLVTPPGAADLEIEAPSDALEASVPLIVQGESGDLVRTTAGTADLVFGLIPQCYGSIAGVMRDAYTGEPIEGGTAGPLTPRAVSDAAGFFITEQLVPRSDYFVTLQAEGYYGQQRAGVAVRCDDVTTLDVELVPVQLGTMSGRVVVGIPDPNDTTSSRAVTPSEIPIEGATVSAAGFTQTGPDGTYLRTDVPLGIDNAPQTYNFSASAPGYWSQAKQRSIGPDEPLVLDFELVEQCEVLLTGSGQVVDEFGLPVGGVEVLFDTGVFDSTLTAISGPDGSFELPETSTRLEYNNSTRDFGLVVFNLPPGYLGAQAENPQSVSTCGPSRLDGYVVVLQGFGLPQENYARVRGTVRDSVTGEPVPGASLLIMPGGPFEQSDANGQYDREILVGFDTDTTELVHVEVRRSERHWDGESPEILAVAGQINEVDTPVLPIDFVTVQGFVRDRETGEPLAGLEVVAQTLDSERGFTDANGFYRIENVIPGVQNTAGFATISSRQDPSSANGFVRYYPEFEQVLIEPGGLAVQNLDLLRECEPATIQGVVVNAETLEPLEDARVQVFPGGPDELTDADGRFLLEGIRPAVNRPNEPRSVEVRASKSGFITATRFVTVFCGARIFLEFGTPVGGFGEVVGTVTDADTAEPLEGVFVGSSFGEASMTDAQGDYSLPNAPLAPDGGPRTWQVTATLGFDSQSAEVVVQSGPPTRQDFQFASEPALGIAVGDEQSHFDPATRLLTSVSTLTVTNTTGETLTGPLAATILIDREGVAMPDAPGADADGNPVFLLLDPGVELPAGEAVATVLRFTRLAPLAFLYDVQLTLGDPTNLAAGVASAGLVPLGVLPPESDTDGDRWHDALDSCPTRPDAEQLDLDADGVGDACEDLVLAPDTTAPTGNAVWLRLAGAAPAGATSVSMSPGTVGTVDAEGRFEIEGPAAGSGEEVELVFQLSGGGSEVHRVELRAETTEGDAP